MLQDKEELHLWVRPEVLELGVLPVVIPEKISVEMLSKLLHLARELGDQGYPTLTYDTWTHIAVRKLGLSAECTEVMFLNCQLFSQQLPPQQDEDNLTYESVVWTLELIILLYIQRVISAHPRIVARQTSMHLLTNDPWPALSSSCSSNISLNSSSTTGVSTNSFLNSTIAGLGKKKLPEEYHLEFIKDSLPELLSLLAGHVPVEEAESRAQKRRSGDWKSFKDMLGSMRGMGVVSIEVVRSLDILFGVTLPSRSGVKLLDAAIDKSFSYQSGYLSKKNTFQKGLFEQWVLSRLDWSPHGEWLCTRRGRRLDWPVLAASHLHRLHAHPPQSAPERLVCISDMVEGITVHLGDATTNTTPKKPARPTDGCSPFRTSSFSSSDNVHSDQLSLNFCNPPSIKVKSKPVLCDNNLQSSFSNDNLPVNQMRGEEDTASDFASYHASGETCNGGLQNGSQKSKSDEVNCGQTCGGMNGEAPKQSPVNGHSCQGDKCPSNSSHINECLMSTSVGDERCQTSYSCQHENVQGSSICSRTSSSGYSNEPEDPGNRTNRKNFSSVTYERNISGNSLNSLTSNARRTFLQRSLSAPSSDEIEEQIVLTPRRSLSVASADLALPSLLDVKIRRCSKSQIYILQPLRHVLLHRLHDTKVVLGPVLGRLRILECRNVTVSGPARSVVISDCRNMTLCTLTPQRPLLVGACSSTGGDQSLAAQYVVYTL
ncbi:Tubulin binding cofactor C-like domain [Trinorchestia longiramus]|nr:Tubulin binding cofactor C-like domain [Trinorchestia longiramus]